MEWQERIQQLGRVKVQLLLSWMSDKEISALLKSSDQNTEDLLLENISRDGRKRLLEEIGVSMDEYEIRQSVIKKITSIYNTMMGDKQTVSTRQRKEMWEDSLRGLSHEEYEIYERRNHKSEEDLSDALLRRLSEYLDKLEKGQGLNAKL